MTTETDQVFTLDLDDLQGALLKRGLKAEDLTEADFYELRERVADGLMSDFDVVADAAVDCMLLDRELRGPR